MVRGKNYFIKTLSLFLVIFFIPIPSFAQSSGISSMFSASTPFGGLTGKPIPCTCTPGYFLIPVRAPNPPAGLPKFIMYSPLKATTYAFGQIPKAGVQVLGLAGPDIMCMIWTGYFCIPIGWGKNVIMVGTSGGGGGTPSPAPPPADDGGDEEQPPPPSPVKPSPNCDRNSLGGWNFNPGIQNQIGDASESLKDLLYCMCNKLAPQGIKGLITSIGDGNHIGRVNECRNPGKYQRCGSGGSCCYHSRTSCHYGGDNADNKSYAVDMGMANSSAVRAAAQSCLAGTVLNEGNHLHIPTYDCRGD